MSFTVVVGSRVQHYLNGIPIGDEEAQEARMIYGEPSHDEEEI